MKPQWTRKFGGLCAQKIDMGKREHQLPGEMSRFILMYMQDQTGKSACKGTVCEDTKCSASCHSYARRCCQDCQDIKHKPGFTPQGQGNYSISVDADSKPVQFKGPSSTAAFSHCLCVSWSSDSGSCRTVHIRQRDTERAQHSNLSSIVRGDTSAWETWMVFGPFFFQAFNNL